MNIGHMLVSITIHEQRVNIKIHSDRLVQIANNDESSSVIQSELQIWSLRVSQQTAACNSMLFF
jgi:hypothetical protein